MSIISQITDHKSRLFVLVLISVIGFLMVPVVIPHILHGYHMLHIALHIIGVTLSAFVALVAFLAYQKFKSKKLMLAQIAFSIFFVAEMVTLVDVTWPGYSTDIISLSEVGHYLLIATLGILAIGIFRND